MQGRRSGEMVDTYVSGAYGEIRKGSSPFFGNIYFWLLDYFFDINRFDLHPLLISIFII